MSIGYHTGKKPGTEQIISLYENAGLPRPTKDPSRIAGMYEHSNLVVTAWDGNLLVGVARCITDWCWSCYLADLAVRADYQRHGIGKKLISLVSDTLGEQCMVLLLSVPGAMAYYPKAGMEKVENGFILNRKK